MIYVFENIALIAVWNIGEDRSGSWEATEDTQVRGDSGLDREEAEKAEAGGQTRGGFQQDEVLVRGVGGSISCWRKVRGGDLLWWGGWQQVTILCGCVESQVARNLPGGLE